MKKNTLDCRKSYSQLEEIFNVRIDTAYNKIFKQHNGDFIFWGSFTDKSEALERLVSRHYNETVAYLGADEANRVYNKL